MKIIHNNRGRILPYLIYLTVAVLIFNILIIAAYFLHWPIATWSVPDSLRIINIVPAILGTTGILGLIPDAYLKKHKKAAIFYFVNSTSFRDFIWFWVSVAVVQSLFFGINVYKIGDSFAALKALDFAAFIASLVCLGLTMVLLLGLFYSRKAK